MEERKGVQCALPGEEGDGNADEGETKESNHSSPGSGPKEDAPGDLLCQEGEVFHKMFTLINTNGVVRWVVSPAAGNPCASTRWMAGPPGPVAQRTPQ